MTVRFLSPQIRITEIDRTAAEIPQNNISGVAAFVGPFERGPINFPTLIRSQKELFEIFGNPRKENKQNRYWISAVNYLSYGGALSITRIDSNSTAIGSSLTYNTAYASDSKESIPGTFIKINNDEVYDSQRLDDAIDNYVFAAKGPGSWANNLSVAIIDAKADERITIASTISGVSIGSTIKVPVLSKDDPDVLLIFSQFTDPVLVGTVSGISTLNGSTSIDIKLSSIQESSDPTKSVRITYSQGSPQYSLSGIGINTTSANISVGTTTVQIGIAETATRISDWYSTQTIGSSNILWKSVISTPPSTSGYAQGFNARNDEIHIVVIDNDGKISQNIQGRQSTSKFNILETYPNLSKATDGQKIPSDDNYYLNVLRNRSRFIYAGEESINSLSASTYGLNLTSELNYGTLVQQDSDFKSVGNIVFNLGNGTDRSGVNNNFNVDVDEISYSYGLYRSVGDYTIDYILSGPSLSSEANERVKINSIIELVEFRADSVACISAYDKILLENSVTSFGADPLNKAKKIAGFFSSPGIPKRSNYTFFDAGIKYVYDQFNREYFYITCNTDTAGLMARNGLVNFPWNSPAGTRRGVLNNVIKLGYNPDQDERDLLYSVGVNSVISLPGFGVLLYGDRTSTLADTAFKQINVRKLFLDIQKVIRNASISQLFEFNNQITRSNFINLIEPYLRNIQTNNGIIEYLVICDETNNTPDIVDSNQFVADIYVKPAKSINFIQLNFIATRTGVSFSEVIGTF